MYFSYCINVISYKYKIKIRKKLYIINNNIKSSMYQVSNKVMIPFLLVRCDFFRTGYFIFPRVDEKNR